MEEMVSIWFGNFATENDLLEYTAESYSEDGDWVSSIFCKEFFAGDEPYEIDFFEGYSVGEATEDIHALLEGCSYDESVIKSLTTVVGDRLKKKYNSVILIFDFTVNDETKLIEGQVDYIATVPYTKM